MILIATLAMVAPALVPTTAGSSDLTFAAYDIEPDAFCKLREMWIEQILATHEPYTWAPMRIELDDAMLALMGLPSREWLMSHRFPQPTMVSPDGATEVVELPAVDPVTAPAVGGPAVVSFAGAGCMGIRPGAFLLLIDEQGIGWCSMAHAFGSPGSYSISTAGHCGGVGTVATAIAAVGNRNGIAQPILLDFGKFSKSTGDGGLGRDWALISVESQFQHLVSPTMCAWGGPLGMYTAEGATVGVKFPRKGVMPTVSVDPNPFLVQTIAHYGHGTGVGTAGTARVGEAIAWESSHFMFFGAISPGDSGSGTNALGGDGATSVNEAGGINTHLWVDPLMRSGLGVMAGTRSTAVAATLANGQIVPYPVPVPGAP